MVGQTKKQSEADRSKDRAQKEKETLRRDRATKKNTTRIQNRMLER